MSEHDDDEAVVQPRPKRRKGPTRAQTMGGVLFGFEQQIWRTAPPAQEMVHHARPDAPVPAGDGSFLTITMPGDERPAHDDVAVEAADAADGGDSAEADDDAAGAAARTAEPGHEEDPR
jgi:hypothetical protein